MHKHNQKVIQRRLLERELASYILGESQQFEISGTSAQIQVVREAADSSRRLYHKLLENESFSDVRMYIIEKKKSAQKFKETFGYTWPF